MPTVSAFDAKSANLIGWRAPDRFWLVGVDSNAFLYGVLVRSAACVVRDLHFLFFSARAISGTGGTVDM